MLRTGAGSRWRCLVMVAVVLVAGARLASADGGPPASSCAVVDIHEIGWERLQAVSGAAGVDWWIELGGELLVCGDGALASRLAATRPLRELPDPVDLDRMWVARGLSEDQLDQMGLEFVAGAGRLVLVSLRPGAELLAGAGDAARERPPGC